MRPPGGCGFLTLNITTRLIEREFDLEIVAIADHALNAIVNRQHRDSATALNFYGWSWMRHPASP